MNTLWLKYDNWMKGQHRVLLDEQIVPTLCEGTPPWTLCVRI
jgi:hypothetical protein